MRALNTKLWRDLQRLWAQVLTIALVLAIGVAGFVGMFSVHESLQASRESFYRDNRLADVFIRLQRAPVKLRDQLLAIQGVADVQLSVVMDAQIALPDAQAPVTGRFMGLDLVRVHAQRQGLNALSLRSGRWPEAGRTLEAVVSERFAKARHLQAGERVHAILNGRLEEVHITGTVISPEYVFASRGEAPDDQTFGIWWIAHERMAQAFGMQGAFNQAALRLDDPARQQEVIDQVDALLTRYGTHGAVGRDQQISAKMVSNELSQLKVMGTVLPSIFLAVSIFILNVVVSRQVSTQRSQIATLKALGYPDHQVAMHYMGLTMLITVLGLLAGLLLSRWIGQPMLGLYNDIFRFKRLEYTTSVGLVMASTALTLPAAMLGTWGAIRTVMQLRPAVAMQPLTPETYHQTLLERMGLVNHVGAGTLMVIRNFARRPWRALLTVTGMALAVALQISGAFWLDALDHITDVQFRHVQRGDVVVYFQQPVPLSVVQDLQRMPGVMYAEAHRAEAVRVHWRQAKEEAVLLGLPDASRLLRAMDEQRGPVPAPAQGLVLSGLLAKALGVRQGEEVEVEFLMWQQTRARIKVVDVVHTLMGKQAFMNLDSMNTFSRDGSGVTQASLHLDSRYMSAFWTAVKQAPVITAVFDKASSLAGFQATTSRSMGVFSAILTLFAVAMAVGIVYNAARISLSERAWELASLRVLGMSRTEVSVLLLAQLAIELLLALPVGAAIGWALASLLMHLMSSDSIDFPVVIARSTYAWAVLIVLAAGLVSALLVRQKIDQLDLVAVLKVRE